MRLRGAALDEWGVVEEEELGGLEKPASSGRSHLDVKASAIAN